MEIIVLLLFLGFFYYLGRRLWDRREAEIRASVGQPGSGMNTQREATSYGGADTREWQQNTQQRSDNAGNAAA